MKISVIIPTYNRAVDIEQAIQSVLGQTYPPHEIIVVDDHSSDDTAEVLESYADKIIIINNKENRGVSYSRNMGIKAATGDWVAFLDSDDRWDKDKLNAQKNYHENNPELQISQCDEIWIRNGVRVNPMAKHAKVGGWIFEACIPRCIVSPSAVIIHKDIFQDVGLFDPELMACEDYDLWLRIAPFYQIGYLDEKLVTRYGGHEDQLSKKYWGMDRFRITAMEKQLSSKLKPQWKTTLLKELSFKCGIVADGAKKRGRLEDSVLYRDKQQTYQGQLET